MHQQFKPPENVVEILKEDDSLSLFVEALYRTDLDRYLSEQKEEQTIFAPLDSAFEKLPPERFDNLFRNENRDALRKVVRRHVVARKIRASSLKNAEVETLGGAMVRTESTTNRRTFGGGELTRTDILASNGLIHTIDRVVLPDNLDEMLLQ